MNDSVKSLVAVVCLKDFLKCLHSSSFISNVQLPITIKSLDESQNCKRSRIHKSLLMDRQMDKHTASMKTLDYSSFYISVLLHSGPLLHEQTA